MLLSFQVLQAWSGTPHIAAAALHVMLRWVHQQALDSRPQLHKLLLRFYELLPTAQLRPDYSSIKRITRFVSQAGTVSRGCTVAVVAAAAAAVVSNSWRLAQVLG